MPKKILDLAGHKFGDLTVIEMVGRKTHRTIWNCRCVCGNKVIVNRDSLRNGVVKDCGCHAQADRERRHIPHGHTSNGRWTPEYSAWKNMLHRCENPNYKHWRDYGGRGIKVSPRWNNFQNFFDDMGLRPSSDYSLDRIDVNGNYEPLNCRWATRQQQILNRRPILRAKRECLDLAVGALSQIALWEIPSHLLGESVKGYLQKLARDTIETIQVVDRGERRIGAEPTRVTGRDAPQKVRIGSFYASHYEIAAWMESSRSLLDERVVSR